MADEQCSSSLKDFQGDYRPSKGLENDEEVTRGKQVTILEVDESGEVDPFVSDLVYGIHTANMVDTKFHLLNDQQQTTSDCWMQNDLPHNTNVNDMLLPVQSTFKATKHKQPPSLNPGPGQPNKRKPYLISSASSKHLSRYRREKEKSTDEYFSESTQSDRKLSTEEIIRVAGDRYIQFSTKNLGEITTFIHPYGSALSSLSMEETRSTDIVHVLLAAAEKVSCSQFDSARRLLAHCEGMTSESGNPVERIAFYFSEALRERINRETGSITARMLSENVKGPNGLTSGIDLTVLSSHHEVPFSKVMQFASMQTLLDHISMATKVHLIDLQIRSGIHWTILIQALSERKDHPIEVLRITALDTKDKQKVEEIGKRLQSFANSLDIPFSFKVVLVSNMKYLKEELFDIKYDEVVAVYAPTVLRTMISTPDTLETLMRIIERLRPLIMVLCEVEASQNSPLFVNRLIEALFFYSAWFDCLEDCMDRDNQYRMDLERFHFGKGIQNTIATEGEERITRSVKINVWRSYFARFRMVEVEISESSLHQANLVLKQQFSCVNSCTLDKNGKCLIAGWKGTPMFSLSTWKF